MIADAVICHAVLLISLLPAGVVVSRYSVHSPEWSNWASRILLWHAMQRDATARAALYHASTLHSAVEVQLVGLICTGDDARLPTMSVVFKMRLIGTAQKKIVGLARFL